MTDQKKAVGLAELIETVADQGLQITKLEQALANITNNVQGIHTHLTFISQVVKYTVQDSLEYTTEYKIATQPTQANYIRAQWKSDPETMAMTLEGDEYVNGEPVSPINSTEITNQLKMEIIKYAIQYGIPAETDFYLTRYLLPVDPRAKVENSTVNELPTDEPVDQPLVEVLDDVQEELQLDVDVSDIDEAEVVQYDTPVAEAVPEAQS